MGRLPKGFKKTLQHKSDKEELAEEAAAAPAKAAPAAAAAAAGSKPAQRKSEEHAPNPRFLKDDAAGASSSSSQQPKQQHAALAAAAAPAAAAADSDDDEEADGASHAGPETRGQMIQRHKREMQAFKKNLPRMGKKGKDEVAKLTAELEAKHAKELADLDAASTQSPAAQPPAAAAAAGAAVSAAAGMAKLQVGEEEEEQAEAGGAKGMTKAMKRRQKHAAAEAEREARLAAEAAEAGPSMRAQEEEALVALLKPQGLRMREIRADGHCLYRSLEDQLSLLPDKAAVMDFQQLRKAAAEHIRKHPDQYIHYMDVHDGENGEAALARYCDELEHSAVWGGQLELSVLAQVLRRPIKVLAVGLPPLTLGEEFNGAPLQVCYLRHAFGLGEHYNSLEPAADDT